MTLYGRQDNATNKFLSKLVSSNLVRHDKAKGIYLKLSDGGAKDGQPIEIVLPENVPSLRDLEAA